MSCTPHEIDLMRHALGVQKRGRKWSKPYRNYFAACDGDADHRAWASLELRGFAARRSPLPCTDYVYYQVTPAGRDIALAGLPKSVTAPAAERR